MQTLHDIFHQMHDFGMTQPEIAKKTGFSQAYVSLVMCNKRGCRTPKRTLERVQRVRDRVLKKMEIPK